MEEASSKLILENPEHHQSLISPSFSFDGYERLHEEAMDKISVSVHYSDNEEAFDSTLRENLANFDEKIEKKMKISLSQEQLKLNCNTKNFLSVPTRGKQTRSASFSLAEKKSVKIDPIIVTPSTPEASSLNETSTFNTQQIAVNDGFDDGIIYAVPRRHSPKEENEIKISSASSLPSKSVAVAPTLSSELNKSFKYPLSFYCKLCNNLLNDPRTLDCLHSFCVQCLARLDASNDLQNNQFWRKISEHSDASCEFTAKQSMCR